MTSLRARLVATSVLLVLATLVVTGVILTTLLRGHLEREFDAQFGAFLDELVAAVEVDEGDVSAPTRPLSDPRFRKPFSGLYWQVADADGPVLRSRSLWDATLVLPPIGDGAVQRHIVAGPRDEPLVALARSVTFPRGTVAYRFAVASDRSRILALADRFTRVMALTLGGMALGLGLALWLQVTIGLRPLGAVRGALARVHAGAAATVEGRYPTEIQPLVDDLNAVLGAYRGVLDRARSQAGNLAHGLKTPLAILANEADWLAANVQAPAAAELPGQVAAMQAQIDRHLALARAAGAAGIPGAGCDVDARLRAIAHALGRLHEGRAIDVAVEVPAGMHVAIDAEDADEIFGNLLDNAFKWASVRVRIAAHVDGDRVLIDVDDDGPGLTEAQIAVAFERGRRLDERAPGSGLGLAIAHDVAELAGGAIALDRAPLGGLRARVTLPVLKRPA